MQDPTTPGRPFSEAPSSSMPGAGPTGSGAATPAGSIGEQAREVAGQAAATASLLVDQVKDKTASTVEGHKAGLADQLEDAAQAIQQSGEQLRGRQDWLAGAVDRGAAELSAFASSLREKDLGELVGEIQSFARRQPAAFIGASFAAGFALARLGKLVAADVSRDDLPSLPEIDHGQG